MSSSLDRRDLEVLKFLAGREANGEGPPSTREVAGAAGLKSPRSGLVRLRKLVGESYIVMREGEGNKRRPVKLTSSGWEVVGEMPVLGRISAGSGIDAVAVGGVRSVLWRGILTGETFLLEVKGDSMTGAGIEDGDSVIVEREESPEDGEIVVALLHGETVTVKRLYRDGERVRLKPENPAYEDIVVSGDEVVVQGRVRGLLRSLGR